MTGRDGGAPGSVVPPPLSKVALDKTLSGALLVVLSPVFATIAAAVALESALSSRARGPVFHTEVRVSAGRPFRLYKFRILTVAAERLVESGARPKDVENDARNLTRVGSLLKKVGLDEMPQLLHILRGEMSFVGPRPKPANEYDDLVAAGQIFRAQLRAGLTGPSQVLKGTDPATRHDVDDEFAYLELLGRGSTREILATDIRMLRRTVTVLLKATGE